MQRGGKGDKEKGEGKSVATDPLSIVRSLFLVPLLLPKPFTLTINRVRRKSFQALPSKRIGNLPEQ